MGEIKSARKENGKYTNPILYCDYSDPDAIRVGDDFFMTASSFTDTPGLPLLHSKNLIDWEVINYCIKNVPDESYNEPRYGCGVWAPSIRYHDGIYYVVFPMPDEGIFVTKTSDPWGEWSEPVNIFPGAGRIDPCPFWDDDGQAYLVYGVAKSRIGFNNKLFICKLSEDCSEVMGESVEVFDGESIGVVTTEGPKLYKRNGYYYIFAPCGGVKPGVQLAMRSTNIFGPYEAKVVLKEGLSGINGPHQGAWVDTPDGEDWFIHFRDVYAAGRIVYLEPMKWENDWPVIGKKNADEDCGEAMAECDAPTIDYNGPVLRPESSDFFENGKPNSAWQWNSNHEDDWTENAPKGILLKCIYKEDLMYAAHKGLLLQKWPAAEFDLDVTLDASSLEKGTDRAGVICFGMRYAGILIKKEETGLSLVGNTGEMKFVSGAPVFSMRDSDNEYKCRESCITIRISVRRDGTRPGGEIQTAPKEKVSFCIKNEGQFVPLLEFEPEAGRWTGAKCGVFADTVGTTGNGFVNLISAVYNFDVH